MCNKKKMFRTYFQTLIMQGCFNFKVYQLKKIEHQNIIQPPRIFF